MFVMTELNGFVEKNAKKIQIYCRKRLDPDPVKLFWIRIQPAQKLIILKHITWPCLELRVNHFPI